VLIHLVDAEIGGIGCTSQQLDLGPIPVSAVPI
jgi:hypothetical protein